MGLVAYSLQHKAQQAFAISKLGGDIGDVIIYEATTVTMTKMEALSGVSSGARCCKFSDILYRKEDSYEAAYSPAYKGPAVGEQCPWHRQACCSTAPPEAFQALAATYCWPKDAPLSTRSCTAALEGRRPRGWDTNCFTVPSLCCASTPESTSIHWRCTRIRSARL